MADRNKDGFYELRPKLNGPFDLFIKDKRSKKNGTDGAKKKKLSKKEKRALKKTDPDYWKVGMIDVRELRPISKKTHGGKKLRNLFSKMITIDEIKEAINEAAKGKRGRKEVKRVLANIDYHARRIQKKLKKFRWHPPKHRTHHINEGSEKKPRDITKPKWDDEQIVHHLVIRRIQKMVLGMINDNVLGSIPHRGTHKAMKIMARWVKGYHGRKFFVAELDIRKFYDSINHRILRRLLRMYIDDEKFLKLLFKIIKSYRSDRSEGKTKRGLPLGNYTSPWFANFYLLQMDFLILQDLPGVDHYLRYMDNIYIFSTNKRQLHRATEILSRWLDYNLDLEIKDNWQVFRFEHEVQVPDGRGGTKAKVLGRHIDCLGFMIHHNRVTLRKGILHRLLVLATKMGKMRGAKFTFEQCTSMASRYGYLLPINCNRFYREHIVNRAPKDQVTKKVSNFFAAQKEIDDIYGNDLLTAFTVGLSDHEVRGRGILEELTLEDGTVVTYLNPKLLLNAKRSIATI